MTDKKNDKRIRPFGSAIEFSSFGKSTLAYIRRVNTDDLPIEVTLEENLPADTNMWALFGADGKPLALADEMSMILQDAEDHDLVAMQRH
ncbi:DUF1150 family protein [Pseudahrensia aquimaris]|uniref:DUF1150 family protein n=1 Tax=Pseudahrensia aquimaris TaxID=744461 RepID=A0ABW3FDG5_9HYPH